MKDKMKKRKGLIKKGTGNKTEEVSTIDEMAKILKFRSKNPKVIDLTGGDDEGRMPATLEENAVRCSKEEKDLYMFYYLSKKSCRINNHFLQQYYLHKACFIYFAIFANSQLMFALKNAVKSSSKVS